MSFFSTCDSEMRFSGRVEQRTRDGRSAATQHWVFGASARNAFWDVVAFLVGNWGSEGIYGDFAESGAKCHSPVCRRFAVGICSVTCDPGERRRLAVADF